MIGFKRMEKKVERRKELLSGSMIVHHNID